MTVSADTLTLQPVAAPIAPPPVSRPAVAAVGQRDGAATDRRSDSRSSRDRANVSFRSYLSAATFTGLAQTLSNDNTNAASSADTAQRRAPRAVKLPASEDPTVISSEESESLYRSAQAAKQTTSSARASQFRAVTSRYAKSFFAVSGTFARPGESIELTA